MKKIITYCLLFLLNAVISSCGSSSKNKVVLSEKTKSAAKTKATNTPGNKKIKSIISFAKSFSGTKYKFGGTTKKGMDCSGLIYTSFKKENVILPRMSKTMATQGKAIALKKVSIGDLLFFKTNKRKNSITHVGLVVETKGVIKFIHASTSRGVIISSLNEKYWSNAFAWARRVL